MGFKNKKLADLTSVHPTEDYNLIEYFKQNVDLKFNLVIIDLKNKYSTNRLNLLKKEVHSIKDIFKTSKDVHKQGFMQYLYGQGPVGRSKTWNSIIKEILGRDLSIEQKLIVSSLSKTYEDHLSSVLDNFPKQVKHLNLINSVVIRLTGTWKIKTIDGCLLSVQFHKNVCTIGKKDHPIVNVSYHDKYCSRYIKIKNDLNEIKNVRINSPAQQVFR